MIVAIRLNENDNALERFLELAKQEKIPASQLISYALQNYLEKGIFVNIAGVKQNTVSSLRSTSINISEDLIKALDEKIKMSSGSAGRKRGSFVKTILSRCITYTEDEYVINLYDAMIDDIPETHDKTTEGSLPVKRVSEKKPTEKDINPMLSGFFPDMASQMAKWK
jgi:metal-responsive CopG/Arc/MetJ family transcriptional regulator